MLCPHAKARITLKNKSFLSEKNLYLEISVSLGKGLGGFQNKTVEKS